MIVKASEEPLTLEKLEALERRMDPCHNKLGNISGELAKRKAGYQGERNVSYFTKQLPESTFVFHNLRLPWNNTFFEMDLFLITSSFSLIVETKTLAGEIHFDSNFGQLIRTRDNKKETFPDPLAQVQRQRWLLNDWFIHHVGFNIPIEYLVVVGNSSTLISTDPGKAYLYKKVIHANKLPLLFKEISAKFRSEILDQKTLVKIRNKLLKEHTPLDYDVLGKFHLKVSDIIKGVQCPNCHTMGMSRNHGGWICNYCRAASKDAHVQALKDYFLLFSNSISNQKCREFLKIDSSDIVYRLFKDLNVTSRGKNKGKIYFAPEKISSLALK